MKAAIVIFALSTLSLTASAQKMDTTLRLSIQVGAGWTHYHSNLVIANSSIRQNFIGSSLRIMWEPEHRLSIGIESGYYKLYDVTLDPGDVGDAEMAVIPVFAIIRMRIVKGLFLAGGTGTAFLNSAVHTPGNPVTKSTVISYSNAQVSLLYLFKLTEQFGIGSEAKVMWIDKTDDSFYSLQAIVSYRF